MMKKRFAKLISVIFHPLFLTFLSTAVITIALGRSIEMILENILFLFIIIILFPLSILFLLKQTRVISDLDLSKREERKSLQIFLIVLGIFILDLILINIFFNRDLYIILYISLVIAYLISYGISQVFKISGHVSILTLNILFLGLFINLYILVALIIIPIMIWSRVSLKRHSLSEAVSGILLGSFVGLGVFLIDKLVV